MRTKKPLPFTLLDAASVGKMNQLLARMPGNVRIRRGQGYHYFHGGDAFSWKTSSIMAFRLDLWTIGEVLWELASLRYDGEPGPTFNEAHRLHELAKPHLTASK